MKTSDSVRRWIALGLVMASLVCWVVSIGYALRSGINDVSAAWLFTGIILCEIAGLTRPKHGGK